MRFPIPLILTTVIISWSGADNVTGIVGTTNMVNWYEITNFPSPGLTNVVSVTLSNRPACEFYRVFNRR